MDANAALLSKRFPLSSKYHPEWVVANVSGGANSLWLTEWLAEAMDLRPGMRVLDLGCGRASSSIFLRREFEVEVWATDLWFSPSENLERIEDAGVGGGVYPIHADARALPFANGFFDAIVSVDAFCYFGTDDLYLKSLARYLKPGGRLGIVGAGFVYELDGEVPEHLQAWWEKDLWSLHSADWWRRHWEKSGILDIEVAESMTDGWELWVEWLRAVAPENLVEIEAIEGDRGRTLGYHRVVGRRRPDVVLDEPILSVSMPFKKTPLLRSDVSG